MYTFHAATDRILHMRKLIRDRTIQVDAERALIVTDSFRKNENVIPVIKARLRSMTFAKK